MIVCGLIALGAGAVAWSRSTASLADVQAKLASSTEDLKAVQAERREANLRYRGYKTGMEAIPDSVRMYAGGVIMNHGAEYQKQIYGLNIRERDVKLEVARHERSLAKIRRGRSTSAIPFGVIGMGLLAVGAMFAVRSRHPDPA